MLVSDLGEFGLIDRLAAALSSLPRSDLLVGIGDDAAVWRSGRSLTIATTDTMVDGIHFLSAQADPVAVGWKAAVSNLSDINAMGGMPRYALVTLGLPPDTPVSWVDGLYAGLRALAEAGAVIAGGDIVRSPVRFLTVALTGAAPARRDWRRALLLRSAARPGDIVAVSGTLGGPAGGLLIRLGERDAPPSLRAALLAAHDRPQPPLGLGARLVALGVRCGMDLSDGLAGDLPKLCAASGVGAEIELARLPIHPALRQAWPEEAPTIAATGGEEYELLVTCRPAVWRRVLAAGLPLTAIGRIVATPGVRFAGAAGPLVGWDHLARSGA
ncbi:MAG: thiamine-phosphate kinase [Chloroflexota bacterium]|nr:thiamine-phosphate kinase [Dehalococcoidia bacterium]MDW8254755.1 thiamine-phosphate kinase [Chloroflexota bacterium]